MELDGKKDEWALVQFKPNSDGVAVRNLTRQGFEVFLPKIEMTTRTSSKFIKSKRPLFPGYLFARINLAVGGWRAINSTYGVSRILTTAGKPTPVTESLVEEIRTRCDSDGVVQPKDDFEVGEEVKLQQGPFADLVGKILTLSPDQRVWILLEVLGRKTKVAVNANDLSRIS